MGLIFEKIFENSPVAMLIVNKDSKIYLMNKMAEDLFGYSRDELLGTKLERLVPDSVRENHQKLVEEFFDTPRARKMGVSRNIFGIRKDKTKVPIEVDLNPFQEGDEIFVMSSIIDISERLLAEERFRAAVEAAPNGMVMINGNGKIVLINKKIEEMFGYTRDELIGQPIELLVPDNVKKDHPQLVQSFIASPSPRAMGAGRDLSGKRKDGSLIPVEIGLQPIEAHFATYIISSITDITARQQAERIIKEKNHELEQFAYRTSHDLRSPLVSIHGLTDFILEDLKSKNIAEVKDNVLKIKFLSDHLQEFVQNILNLGQIEGENLTDIPFDFEKYVSDAKQKFSQPLSENDVALKVNFNHHKTIETQPARLKQIMDNLVSNSIKYADPSQPSKYVSLKTQNDGEQFLIVIEDNGVGIPESKRKDMFKMFKRFHSGSVSGSGLGLYIVKKHVQKLDGDISYQYKNGLSIFSVRFAVKK